MSTMTSPCLNEVHDADLSLLADTKSGAWKVIAGDGADDRRYEYYR
jgi:hypothetical protein